MNSALLDLLSRTSISITKARGISSEELNYKVSISASDNIKFIYGECNQRFLYGQLTLPSSNKLMAFGPQRLKPTANETLLPERRAFQLL